MTSEAECLLKILWENSGNEHFSPCHTMFPKVSQSKRKKKKKIGPHVICHTANAFTLKQTPMIIMQRSFYLFN